MMRELQRNLIEDGIREERVNRRIGEMVRSFPDALDLYPRQTIQVLEQQAVAYRREPTNVSQLLPLLHRTGARTFAAEFRRHIL